MGIPLISDKSEIARIKTHIEGLDEVMQGGIPKGNVTLLSGVSGTMKSSLAFSILYYNCLEKRNGVYLSLEQSYISLLNHMVNLDIDLSKINLVITTDLSKLENRAKEATNSSKGTLFLIDLAALRKEVRDTKTGERGNWLNVIKNIVRKVKTQIELDLFTLDSMSALYVLSDLENPRTDLFHLFEFFRDEGVTSFFISEMPLDRSRYGEFDVEDYLSDGIIFVDRTEKYRKVVRSVAIIKMRATDCDLDIYTLEFENGKFKAVYGGQPPLV